MLLRVGSRGRHFHLFSVDYFFYSSKSRFVTHFPQQIRKMSETSANLVPMDIDPSEFDYTKWSKGDLITRIKSLEQQIGNPSTPKRKKVFDFSKFTTRHVAIRFAYLGWNYSGLAVQLNSPNLETVEGHILDCMYKAKLIPTRNPQDCNFSRCGRTDKGVSAFKQVISLNVRSVLSLEDQKNPEKDEEELDYLHILNQILPEDIRLYEICLQPPPDFDARFSCSYRRYKYFFHYKGPEHLNLEEMQRAATMFEGEHDFRNFCKVDPSKQITNFRRNIDQAMIIPANNHQAEGLYCVDLRGKAFLWHQVRSMVAVLLLVGQGLEPAEIVRDLLDVEKYPGKPIYEMAADIPLVLWDCGFPDNMVWKSFKHQDSLERLQNRLYASWHGHLMRCSMSQHMMEAVLSYVQPPYSKEFANYKKPANRVVVNLGNGVGKNLAKYVPLAKRKTMDSPEVVNEKWLKKNPKAQPEQSFTE